MSENNSEERGLTPFQRAFSMQLESLVDCICKQIDGKAAEPYLEAIRNLQFEMLKMSKELDETRDLNRRLTSRLLDITAKEEE